MTGIYLEQIESNEESKVEIAANLADEIEPLTAPDDDSIVAAAVVYLDQIEAKQIPSESDVVMVENLMLFINWTIIV